MLILSRKEVERLLDVDKLVDTLAAAMVEVSAGRVSMPPRVAAMVPEHGGLLATMPVYLAASGTLSTKLVTVFPANVARGLESHQALIAVFDATTGLAAAVMDGAYITAVRTAAGSALATRLLARPDANVLAIIGTGVQARAHARAVARVHGIQEIRIAGRSREKTEALATEISKDLQIPARPFTSIEECVRGAGIVCGTTDSAEPVIRGAWIEPGMHLNSVGFNIAGREVDGEAMARATVVVESRAAVLAPPPAGANDLAWAIRDGEITADRIHAEIGELVSGTRPGRTSPEEITLYKSVGVAAQDAAAAQLVLDAAAKQGAGKTVEF